MDLKVNAEFYEDSEPVSVETLNRQLGRAAARLIWTTPRTTDADIISSTKELVSTLRQLRDGNETTTAVAVLLNEVAYKLHITILPADTHHRVVFEGGLVTCTIELAGELLQVLITGTFKGSKDHRGIFDQYVHQSRGGLVPTKGEARGIFMMNHVGKMKNLSIRECLDPIMLQLMDYADLVRQDKDFDFWLLKPRCLNRDWIDLVIVQGDTIHVFSENESNEATMDFLKSKLNGDKFTILHTRVSESHLLYSSNPKAHF